MPQYGDSNAYQRVVDTYCKTTPGGRAAVDELRKLISRLTKESPDADLITYELLALTIQDTSLNITSIFDACALVKSEFLHSGIPFQFQTTEPDLSAVVIAAKAITMERIENENQDNRPELRSFKSLVRRVEVLERKLAQAIQIIDSLSMHADQVARYFGTEVQRRNREGLDSGHYPGGGVILP